MRTRWMIIGLLVFGSGITTAKAANHFATAIEQGSPVWEGNEGWLFFVPELRYLTTGSFWGEDAQTASRARMPDTRDPLPAILDFHRALQEIGINLLLVPVPPKAVVHGDQLGDGHSAERLDHDQQAFYALLRQEGVPVLDLTDRFLSLAGHDKGPLYCRTDTHWSGVGVVEAAKAIAAHLGDSGPLSLATEWIEIEIEGDLTKMRGDTGAESLQVRRVNGTAVDAESPIILLGDSHTLVFHAGGDMHTTGAGLPEQLAVELGSAVDLIGVRGSGATPARINLFRRAQRNSDYWSGKQVVIWVFAAREFTESDGWRLVPIKL